MTQLTELKAQYRRQADGLPLPALAELEAKRDELVVRLNKGWDLVKPGGEREHDDRYHDHFEGLLHEYEVVCDQITEG